MQLIFYNKLKGKIGSLKTKKLTQTSKKSTEGNHSTKQKKQH